jgi:hypothetical protein
VEKPQRIIAQSFMSSQQWLGMGCLANDQQQAKASTEINVQ